MKRLTTLFAAAALACAAGTAFAQAKEIKIAHVYDKTGPLEAYAKQTQTGLMMGLEYATGGKMSVLGRKIVRDREGQRSSSPTSPRRRSPPPTATTRSISRSARRSPASALAMLPVAEEYKKILLVEPAVADSITGEKWNRYIFRTGRNSTQDAVAGAVTLPANAQIATLAQDYAFGRDGVKAFKEALAAVGSKAKIVHEEYAPPTTTDFTAPAQRMFDALKDKPGRSIIAIIWAGAQPGDQACRPQARALRHRARAGRQHPAGDEDLEGTAPASRARSTTTTSSRRTR